MSITVSLEATAMKWLLGEYLMSDTASLRSFISCSGRRFSPSSRIWGGEEAGAGDASSHSH